MSNHSAKSQHGLEYPDDADSTQIDIDLHNETEIIQPGDVEDSEDDYEESESEYPLKSPALAGLYQHLPPISVLAGSTEVSATAYGLGIFLGVCASLSLYLILQLAKTSSISFFTYISAAVLASLNPSSIPWQIPVYGVSLSIFHFLEYYTTAKYNPSKVTPTSFLLKNGSMYIFAHALSISESLLERYFGSFLPPYIRLSFSNDEETQNPTMITISLIGLAVVILGQSLRSAAMIHAASNFSHSIVRVRDHSHELVTTGVYSFSRHPSYAGFFFWALGTQLLLVNPVSFLVFWVLLWKFFKSRIEDEERLLVKFFGSEYEEYRKRVSVKIPFI